MKKRRFFGAANVVSELTNSSISIDYDDEIRNVVKKSKAVDP